MDKKTRRVATAGVMAALSMVLLFAASVIPSGKLVVTALAGAVGAVTVIKNGIPTGVLNWIAVSLLALLLLPDKGCAILYAVFFGPYTILKSLIERIHVQPVEWMIKYVFCIAMSCLLYFFASDVLNMFPNIFAEHMLLFLTVVAVGFLAYDVIFSKLISELARRLIKI